MEYLKHIEGYRHVVSLSGGKDSSALAIFLRDKIPNLEYVFCDTGAELPETYEYLDRLEAYLGKKIVRLNAGVAFEQFLNKYSNYLPSPRSRWCTREMKILPYEIYLKKSPTISYVGIRADEDREGYITSGANIIPRYPFKEEGMGRDDVFRILEESGLNLPKYYEWRSRSGCYFCFFQRNIEWVGLLEKHPDLYEKAKSFEDLGYNNDDVKFTWVKGRRLDWIAENKEAIKASHEKRMDEAAKNPSNKNVHDVFEEAADEESDEKACLICDL